MFITTPGWIKLRSARCGAREVNFQNLLVRTMLETVCCLSNGVIWLAIKRGEPQMNQKLAFPRAHGIFCAIGIPLLFTMLESCKRHCLADGSYQRQYSEREDRKLCLRPLGEANGLAWSGVRCARFCLVVVPSSRSARRTKSRL